MSEEKLIHKSGGLEELTELVGSDDEKQVERSIKSLKKEVANLRSVGRTLRAPDSKEFVIPLESKEHKERMLRILTELNIFPWEENGLLIIDHKKDLKKLDVFGVRQNVVSLPDDESRVITDPGYKVSFPQKDAVVPKKYKQELKKRIEIASGISESETQESEEDSDQAFELDEELKRIILRFEEGTLDIDDDEFIKHVGFYPTLKLFPRQYLFKKGTIIEKRTGEVLGKDEHDQLFFTAQNGDAKAFDKLARIHSGLVLSRVLLYKERHTGDPDDLFQEGMIGLIQAISGYNPKEYHFKFSTYAVPKIDARIMRYGFRHRDPVVRSSTASTNYLKMKKATETAAEERDMSPENILSKVQAPGQIRRNKNSHPVVLDRLVRTYFLDKIFDPLLDDIDSEKNINFVLNKTPGSMPLSMIEAEVRKQITRSLNTLPAKYERILRLKFGLMNKETYKKYLKKLNIHKDDNEIHPSDGFTDEQIGILFGVTRGRMWQLETKALRMMKHPIRTRALSHLLSLIEEQK